MLVGRRLAIGALRSAVDAAVGGTCWEGDGPPGFWPWIQVMRALAADADGSGEAVLAGPGSARRWPTPATPRCAGVAAEAAPFNIVLEALL